jgi:hypothetical protein
MGVKHVEEFDDSLLVVQQITDVFQYFDGSLNAYLNECLEIIAHRLCLIKSVNLSSLSKSNSLVPHRTMLQANGRAKSSNKTLIKLIKKKIEENPKRWHKVLLEALYAHHIFKHSTIKVTPFELVYGQEAVLLVEVNLDALRIAR